jgi:hypothetical protein
MSNIYESNNCEKAEMYLIRAFREFASHVAGERLEEYFAAGNTSRWLKDLAAYLIGRI